MATILVIDDDAAVHKILRRTFGGAGFETASCKDGAAALQTYLATLPAAVILDLRLPGKCGQDICRAIREISPSVPILILSAATDELEKVLLLELGADDYVTKPFSPREMLARVRAALRRPREFVDLSSTVQFGDIRLDFRQMELFRLGINVPLTPKEFKLLRFFVTNEERVWSLPELLQHVWDGDESTASSVRTHILRLRQKLEKDPQEPLHLRTVHGLGYKFVR